MKKENTRNKSKPKQKMNFEFGEFFKNLYFSRLFREIRDFYTLYKVTKKNKEFLEELGFRINKIGQPYTVINLPEDVAQQERDIEPYVVLQLRRMDSIFLKLGLTEIIYPEMERIKKKNPGSNENPYEDAFFVLLVTSMETFSFWKLLGHTIKYAFILLIFWILAKMIWVNFHIIQDTFEFIKKYL